MKKIKVTILLLFVIALLTFTFWWGGNAPGLRGVNFEKKNTENEVTDTVNSTESVELTKESEKEPEKDEEVTILPEVEYAEEKEEVVLQSEETLEDCIVDTVSETVEESKEKEMFCTISVRCDTVFENENLLDDFLLGCLPSDGIILGTQQVYFTAGDSVFDILERILREKNIHMEFTATPMYESVYIEGIANLYEFDCGELSGWMYKVNGSFPDYGSSLYEVKEGDVIEWVYTCDRGKDVGDTIN
ncbi:MAG: DUF4430 domain-containing protein [Clostridia bacterium]|nr:DUF4430 domain-containing protein [Clostridia bacterium]